MAHLGPGEDRSPDNQQLLVIKTGKLGYGKKPPEPVGLRTKEPLIAAGKGLLQVPAQDQPFPGIGTIGIGGHAIKEIIFPSIVPDPPIGIRYAGHDGEEARPLPDIEQLLGSLPELGLGCFAGVKHPRQRDDVAEIILVLVRPLVVNTAVIVRIGPLVFKVTHYPAAAKTTETAGVHWTVEVTP